MSNPDQVKWDARYREADKLPVPARVLTDFAHLLPTQGQALDLACGLGGNALFLARAGLDTHAWDLSPVAIEHLGRVAEREGVTVHGQARDVLARPPEPGRFDVLVISRFLERSLTPALMASLRPGGLLFYQTFTRARSNQTGPSNDAYRLADNELLHLFQDLHLLVYREEGTTGDTRKGLRNEAYLVGKNSQP